MSRNRPQGTKSPERLVLHRVLINSKRFYIHTNLIKFVIAHFKLENRSMSCTFQLICIASLLAFSTFILVFMQNCRDCRFSNSEMTPMLPSNTRYDNFTRSCLAFGGGLLFLLHFHGVQRKFTRCPMFCRDGTLFSLHLFSKLSRKAVAQP